MKKTTLFVASCVLFLSSMIVSCKKEETPEATNTTTTTTTSSTTSGTNPTLTNNTFSFDGKTFTSTVQGGDKYTDGSIFLAAATDTAKYPQDIVVLYLPQGAPVSKSYAINLTDTNSVYVSFSHAISDSSSNSQWVGTSGTVQVNVTSTAYNITFKDIVIKEELKGVPTSKSSVGSANFTVPINTLQTRE